MIESSLHREWVSECACVYTKFDPIDFRTSHDIAKKQPFFYKYWQTYREGKSWESVANLF